MKKGRLKMVFVFFLRAKKRRGDITVNNLIGLLVAVAGIIILGFLFFTLVAPVMDENKEIIKSYHSQLKEAIEVADEGETGDFTPFVNTEQNSRFFLVYFGNSRIVKNAGFGKSSSERITHYSALQNTGSSVTDVSYAYIDAYLTDIPSNTLCICVGDNRKYELVKEKETTRSDYGGFVSHRKMVLECSRCIDMEKPVKFRHADSETLDEAPAIVLWKQKILITKFKDYYDIRDGCSFK